MTAYNDRPYLCIFGDCPSSCEGFELAEERDDHERFHFSWTKPSTRSYGFLDGDGGPPPPWKGKTMQRYGKMRNDQTECHQQILQNAQATQETPVTHPPRNGAPLRRRPARDDLRTVRPVDGPLQDLSRFDPEPPMNIPTAVPQPSMGGGTTTSLYHYETHTTPSYAVTTNYGGRTRS